MPSLNQRYTELFAYSLLAAFQSVMACSSPKSSPQSRTLFIDVLPFVISHVDGAQTALRVMSASKSSRDVCLHSLAGNSVAGQGLILAAVNRYLPQLPAIFRHNQIHERNAAFNPKYPLAEKRLPVDGRVCKAEISWALRVCGKSMLQTGSFAADIAAVCACSLKTANAADKMTTAAADVCKLLLAEGCKVSFSNLLSACKARHHGAKGWRAWVVAHAKQSAAFSFSDEDLTAYGLLNSASNCATVTSAIVAISQGDVQSLVSLKLCALAAMSTLALYLYLLV